MRRVYLAADFGGGSGRIIAGHIEEGRNGKALHTTEIYRFPNRCVRIGDYLYWDFPALFAELKAGLSIAAARFGAEIACIGIDTWGVDFGLVDRLGNLVGNPICYRDDHTARCVEKFLMQNDADSHYAKTGIQILSINTLFRLMWMVKAGDPKLEIARKLLFMPDLFSYYLTGEGGNEYTIASTSELLDARTRRWDYDLISSIGVNPELFGKIIMPGESRGTIKEDVRAETGLPEGVKVIAVGSHDTASAVFAAAGDFDSDRTAFLSCGTWSLLGVTTDSPILTPEARKADYTNEGSVGGKIKFLTNITGLWILQQLMEEWRNADSSLTWSALTAEGENAADTCVIDVDDPAFGKPDDMQGRIERYCRERVLNCPQTRGEFVRCVCRSLAMRYKKAVDNLNRLLPHRVERLRVFGGGANNRLLMKFTAEATGIEILKGPAEATSIGNLLVQAIASGDIKDKTEIKEITET